MMRRKRKVGSRAVNRQKLFKTKKKQFEHGQKKKACKNCSNVRVCVSRMKLAWCYGFKKKKKPVNSK